MVACKLYAQEPSMKLKSRCTKNLGFFYKTIVNITETVDIIYIYVLFRK